MKVLLNKIRGRIKSTELYLTVRNRTDNKFVRTIVNCLILPYAAINVLFFDRIIRKPFLKYNLTAAIIIKNEAKYIKEWLNYYKIIGFEKIYVYDNESTDNTYQTLLPFIEDGFVDYYLIKGNSRQMDAYNDALIKSRKESKYIAFLDADEFMFLPESSKSLLQIINKIFSKNSKIGGVIINWLIFGSSGFDKAPKGFVTQNFLYRSNFGFSKNRHVKTICDPRKVEGINNPHYVEYKLGYFSVNTVGEKAKGPFTEYNDNTPIRINHYFTKSKEEFLKKRNRGMADKPGIRDLSDFYTHDKNDVFDNSMSRFKNLLQ
ncbi:glycosyl transferase 2 [Limosilactobacillus coleohominis DSM 14060]|nr:glycosyl transferase 2 [Limosilactobacillus coleohominis DSM 14060]